MQVEYKKIKNIHCKLFLPKDKVKNILVAIHGFAGDKESSVIKAIAENLNETTFVIAFDLPCHGKDEEKSELRLNNCINYLKNILNFIKNQYKNIPISLFATSFGAFISLNYLKSHNEQFRHIILRAPAIFMDEVLTTSILKDHNISLNQFLKQGGNLGFQKEIIVGKNFLQDLKDNSLASHKFSQQIDIIQGDKDDVVDVKKNEAFFYSNFVNFSLHYIKDADHRFKNPTDISNIIKIVKNILG